MNTANIRIPTNFKELKGSFIKFTCVGLSLRVKTFVSIVKN
jgi:hypothetical protein